MHLRAAGVFAGLALMVAAACGGDDSDPAADDPAGADEVTTATAEATSTSAQADATSTPGIEGDDPAPPTTTEAAVELTDSYRGVTAEAISLGIAMVDFQQLNDSGFIDYTHGDTELIWNTLLDDVNANGGILGRRLEPTFETYLPIGNAEAEAACLRLTEDQQVFAVLGLWIGESVRCLTELHDTIHVGHLLQQSWIDASNVPLVSPDITAERTLEALLTVLLDTGRLDGATVGVYTDHMAESSVGSVVVPTLAAAGVDMGSVGVLSDSGGDMNQVEAETAVFIERWIGEGVDTIIIVGNNGVPHVPQLVDAMDVLIAADRTGVVRQQAPVGGRPDAYDGLLVVNGLNPTGREQLDEPAMAACIETFESANPDIEVLPPGELGDEVADWFAGLRNACTALAVFEQVAAAAGPELTNATFTEALESFGDIELPGKVYASFGPEKYDADDGFRLYEFDSSLGDEGGFVPLTDIVDITP